MSLPGIHCCVIGYISLSQHFPTQVLQVRLEQTDRATCDPDYCVHVVLSKGIIVKFKHMFPPRNKEVKYTIINDQKR